MLEYPHRYEAHAIGEPTGDVTLESPGLNALASAAPSQFGGPGNRWSPETMLTAAVADCFVLTFRAMARAAKLPWSSLICDAQGTLDRDGGVPRFTEFRLRAHLAVPSATESVKAQQLLERVKGACLISNSLTAPTRLDAHVTVVGETVHALSA